MIECLQRQSRVRRFARSAMAPICQTRHLRIKTLNGTHVDFERRFGAASLFSCRIAIGMWSRFLRILLRRHYGYRWGSSKTHRPIAGFKLSGGMI